MATLHDGDGGYESVFLAWLASKGETFLVDAVMWRVIKDGANVFFVSLPTDENDTYDRDGKWSKYYGPRNVPDEI